MSQFGRQSGGEGIDSDEDVDVDVTPVRSPSPSRHTIGLRDSPSSGWYPSQDSDLERDTAASSGLFFRESSPSAVFQPDLNTRKNSRQSKNSELGEAAGCLVSGIYLVSPRGRSHGREEREDVDEPDETTIFAPISPEFHEDESVGQQRVPFESLEKGLENFEIHQAPLDFEWPNAEDQPELETNEGLIVPTLGPEDETNLDFHEESPVPSGAFVLETPMKYQIGRPPYMVGRSHVNILAHPDRFRFWFDQRCALSPLAFALCTQAASGYRRLQMNRLFARLGSSASQESNRAAFMVLTGRWNTRPEGLENGHQDQLMEPHDSDCEALEAGTRVRKII